MPKTTIMKLKHEGLDITTSAVRISTDQSERDVERV